MPLNFDSKVSVMDIFAIAIGLGTALTVFFGVSTDVSNNSVQIRHNKDNLARIERKADQGDQAILSQLREQKISIKEIRIESAQGREKIIQKLDKLIDRELNGH
jgi:hypothetical protein